MVAPIGPRTNIHRMSGLAFANLAYCFAHCFLILVLSLHLALFQMPIQAFTCSNGSVTLGSAVLLECTPLLYAHRKIVVVQLPGPGSPVACDMFFLHLCLAVGDIPTEVCP